VPAVDLLQELFEPVRGVTIKRMFGGLGVFKDGLMFGLVADDLLYFKADEQTSRAFEKEGFGRWVYDGHKRPVAMPYWQAPERLYDEPDEFAAWARAAFDAARRIRAQSKGGKKAAAKSAQRKATKKPATVAKKKPPARKK
jgi:DNA transformation protein